MSSTSTLDRVFQRSRDLGVRRETNGRWVAGVCLGLARRWHVDPVLVRVAFLLLTLFGGIGIPVYLLCWLLLPAADSSVGLERALRHGDGSAITIMVFAVITTVGVLIPSGDGPRASLLGVLVLGGVVWWLVRSGRLQARRGAEPAADSSTGDAGASEADGSTSAGSAVETPGRPGEGPTTGRESPSAGSSASTSTDVTHWAPVHAEHDPAGTALTERSAPDSASTSAPGGREPMRIIEASPLTPVDRTPSGTGSTVPVHTGAATTVDPAPAPTGGSRRGSWSATSGVVGLAIAATAVTAGLTEGIAARPWLVGLAVGLAVIGAALIVSGLLGRRPPVLTSLAWILGICLAATSLSPTPGTVGDRSWYPVSVAEVQGTYSVGIGDATIDLTAITPDGIETSAPLEIEVDQGIGDLLVVLPPGVAAQVEVDTGIGDVNLEQPGVPDRTVAGGLGVDETFVVGDGAPAYLFRINGGIGDTTFRVADPDPADPDTATEATGDTAVDMTLTPATSTRVLEEIR